MTRRLIRRRQSSRKPETQQRNGSAVRGGRSLPAKAERLRPRAEYSFVSRVSAEARGKAESGENSLNFVETTLAVVESFNHAGIRYALIGGVALGLRGVQRNTFDVDFLVARDDLGKVDEILAKLNFSLRYRSDNVSHFNAANPHGGSIDCIHAFRRPSLRMLERAEQMPVFSDNVSVPVVRPDDLIGLKVQAMANDTRRWTQDLNDIEDLMQIHARVMDWDLLEDFFLLFGFEDMFRTLAERYRAAD